jgi:O-antigen/teichoic acid export membrane protein
MKVAGLLSLLNYCIGLGTAFYLYPMLVKMQGHEGLGLYSTIIILINYSVLANLGITTALVTKLSGIKIARNIKSFAPILKIYIISISLSAVIINAVYTLLAEKIHSAPSIAIHMLLTLLALIKISIDYIESYFKINLLISIPVFGATYIQFANCLLLIFLSRNGIDLKIMLIFMSIIYVSLVFLYILYIILLHLKDGNHASLIDINREFYTDAKWHFIGSLNSALIYQLTIPLSTFIFGLQASGVIAIYSKFIDLARGVSSQIFSPYLPYLVRFYKTGEIYLLRTIHLRFQILFIIFTTLFLLLFGNYANELFENVFNLMPSSILFYSSIALASLIFSESITSIFLAAINAHRNSILLNILQGIMNLAIYPIIYFFGIGYEYIFMFMVANLLSTNFFYNNFNLNSKLISANGK